MHIEAGKTIDLITVVKNGENYSVTAQYPYPHPTSTEQKTFRIDDDWATTIKASIEGGKLQLTKETKQVESESN